MLLSAGQRTFSRNIAVWVKPPQPINTNTVDLPLLSTWRIFVCMDSKWQKIYPNYFHYDFSLLYCLKLHVMPTISVYLFGCFTQYLICHLTSVIIKWFFVHVSIQWPCFSSQFYLVWDWFIATPCFHKYPPPCCSTLKIQAVPAWISLAIHEVNGMIDFNFQCLRMILEPAGIVTPVPLLLHPEHKAWLWYNRFPEYFVGE